MKIREIANLMNKIEKLERVLTADEKSKLNPEDFLTEYEVTKAIELKTPLWKLRNSEDMLTQAHYNMAIQNTLNNLQYVPQNMQTPEMIKAMMETKKDTYWYANVDLSLITNDDFLAFLNSDWENANNTWERVHINFVTQETLDEEEMSDSIIELYERNRKAAFRFYKVAIQDNPINIKYVKEFNDEIITFLESLKVPVPLKYVPKDKQTEKLVFNTLKLNPDALGDIRPDLIDLEMFETYASTLYDGSTHNLSGVNRILNERPELMHRSILKNLFKNNQEAFIQTASSVPDDFLDDDMIYVLIKHAMWNWSRMDAKILKSRMTADMLNKLKAEYSVKAIVRDLRDIIPNELVELLTEDKTAHYKEQMKEDTARTVFFEIPKSEQSKELFEYALNEAEYPMDAHDIVDNIENINLDLLDESHVLSAIGSRENKDFIVNELFPKFPKVFDTVEANRSLARYRDYWKYINPKFIDDEQLLYNMLKVHIPKEETEDKVSYIEDFLAEIKANSPKSSKTKQNVQ